MIFNNEQYIQLIGILGEYTELVSPKGRRLTLIETPSLELGLTVLGGSVMDATASHFAKEPQHTIFKP